MLTIQEIRQLGPAEMKLEITKTKNELFKVRFAVMGGHSKEAHLIGHLRTHLARLLTVEKENSKGQPVVKPVKIAKKKAEKKVEPKVVVEKVKKEKHVPKKTAAPKKAAAPKKTTPKAKK